MTTILIKDKLRQSVEVASGGLRTVLYTTTGQPTFMNIVEKFLLSDIDASLPATVHPAFIINGVEKDSHSYIEHLRDEPTRKIYKDKFNQLLNVYEECKALGGFAEKISDGEIQR